MEVLYLFKDNKKIIKSENNGVGSCVFPDSTQDFDFGTFLQLSQNEPREVETAPAPSAAAGSEKGAMTPHPAGRG